jgi:hypothetical protein
MKPRIEPQPSGTQRPDRAHDRDRERVKDGTSQPQARDRNEKTLPGDRGVNEVESTSQGSE